MNRDAEYAGQQGEEEAWMAEARRQSDEQTVRELLADVYRPEGVDVWLRSYNKFLGGKKPCDLISRGETESVIAVIDMLRTGAFS